MKKCCGQCKTQASMYACYLCYLYPAFVYVAFRTSTLMSTFKKWYAPKLNYFLSLSLGVCVQWFCAFVWFGGWGFLGGWVMLLYSHSQRYSFSFHSSHFHCSVTYPSISKLARDFHLSAESMREERDQKIRKNKK